MMKRICIYWMLLVAVGTAVAQKPHSYYCDFEDAAENANWVLNRSGNASSVWINNWEIGNAVSSLGESSMYISPDSGLHAGYKRTTSCIMIAYRELELEVGRYDVAFDWMCGGDSARAALLVAWIPEKDFKNNKNQDQIVCWPNDGYKDIKWFNDNLLKFNGSELLTGGSVWSHAVNTLESDGTPHRLVYLFVCNGMAQLVQPGPCVDNIQFSRNNCGEPKDMSVQMVGNTASLSWTSSAEEFNLRFHKMGTTKATVFKEIKANSFSVSMQEGVYDIQIQVVCEGDTSVWYNFPTAFVHDSKCFDYLDLTDDRCSYSPSTPSDYHTIDQQDLLQPGKIDYGFTSMISRHTIHYHPEEYDARTYNSVDSEGKSVMPLKTVPDGALASVRVGSWEKSARVARVEYDFTVDAREAAVLMLQYAMVLESSGHPQDIQRPRMTIDIVDYNTGAALSECTTVDLASQTTGEGWYRVPDPVYQDGSRDICWRDWTTLGLNMADYDGRHVKVKITAYGCNASIHYGYAYFVLTCTSGQIKGIHCGWTPTNEFIAPEGFNYRWYRTDMPSETLGRDNVFKVNYDDDRDYAVEITYKSNEECKFTLYANAIPRFPIPEATYKLEQRDCGNYITFTNTSHIRTRNWKTGQEIDTSVPVEYIVWDFDGLSPEGLDTQEKIWNPSFRLPDEEADYHITLRAIVGLCDSVQEFNIHVPRAGEDSIVEKVQLCEGDIFRWQGKYYQTDTMIIDRDYNVAGCDSIHVVDLRFVDAIRDTIDTIIHEGESYTIGTQTFTESGVYEVTLPSSAGCDSIVTLKLTVYANLAMEITSVENPCPGAASFLIETHARKGIADTYALRFGAAAATMGFADQSGSLNGTADNTITVPVPAGALPGYYPFSILFDSEKYGSSEVANEVAVYYPASLIQQRWDDVLGILKAEFNGGYDFVAFQWYRNGQAIIGATEPYLYVEQKLKAGDEYSVELQQANETRMLRSCAYTVPAYAPAPERVQQQKILKNGQLMLIIDGKVYNAQGQLINQQ